MAQTAGRRGGVGDLEPDRLVEMLSRMQLIRAFDSLLPSLYTQGLIRGSTHAAIGQEAVAVGACAGLADRDLITSTHRGHGHTIAKGGDVGRMMAELLGRASGYCRGKGGSMHIADFSIGMLGANGIVGGGFGIATGAALSCKLRRTGQVVLCFFGDGALNQGAFLECGNLAKIWRLPLVLLCENNQFAMSKRPGETVGVDRLTDRGIGIGVPAEEVDGMDVRAVHDAVARAARRAREGDGPSLIVATCYRLVGHFSGDALNYRTKAEADGWWRRDPIVLFRADLVGSGVLTEAAADELAEEAERRVTEALETAKAAPLPAPEAAWEDVFA